MAEYSIQDTTLINMANEIRTMHGTADSMMPSTMINKLHDANTQLSEQESMLIDIVETLQTKAIGTPPKLQSRIITPSADRQIIVPDSGYDGLSQVSVEGDANLVASNIAEGVSIFGVTGTHAGGGGGGSVETCTFSSNNCYVQLATVFDGEKFVTVGSYIDGDILYDLENVVCGTCLLVLFGEPGMPPSDWQVTNCTMVMTMNKTAYVVADYGVSNISVNAIANDGPY